MSSSPSQSPPHRLPIRVRYCECDPMGVAHHAVFPVWFEMGRTEALRDTGLSYRDLEEAGVFLVVVDLRIKYKAPARYDDVLSLETVLSRVTNVRLDHEYTVRRDHLVLATASSTLACVDHQGKLRAIPPEVARLDADRRSD